MTEQRKISRKEQILQCLAQMLESPKAERITTASLAKEVGVSEAALYRHFPSKARMFEGLIEFIEEAIFSRSNLIARDSNDQGLDKCHKILTLLVLFAEKNPGISRIMTGSALTGEHERLRERMGQMFERLDSLLKQILRESEVAESVRFNLLPAVAANMMLALAEGNIQQFVRSNYQIKPSNNWDKQWQAMLEGVIAS